MKLEKWSEKLTILKPQEQFFNDLIKEVHMGEIKIKPYKKSSEKQGGNK